MSFLTKCTNTNCSIEYNNYFDNHCCNCKINYNKSQNHCCKCNSFFDNNFKHCCKCNSTYSQNSCACVEININFNDQIIKKCIDQNCLMDYNSEFEYHCCNCKINISKIYNHCCKCKISYFYDQKHCCFCKFIYVDKHYCGFYKNLSDGCGYKLLVDSDYNHTINGFDPKSYYNYNRIYSPISKPSTQNIHHVYTNSIMSKLCDIQNRKNYTNCVNCHIEYDKTKFNHCCECKYIGVNICTHIPIFEKKENSLIDIIDIDNDLIYNAFYTIQINKIVNTKLFNYYNKMLQNELLLSGYINMLKIYNFGKYIKNKIPYNILQYITSFLHLHDNLFIENIRIYENPDLNIDYNALISPIISNNEINEVILYIY